MKSSLPKFLAGLSALWVALLGASAGVLHASELVGNFHTMGVVLDLPAAIKPDRIKEVRLFLIGKIGIFD